MRDVIPSIERWLAEGQRVALATVVSTLGTAPRAVGAKMAVASGGGIAGSVSGGCIEGAVYDACQAAMRSGQAALQRFGVADEAAWDVGLACGGTIEVLVEPLAGREASYAALRDALAAEQAVALATVAAGPQGAGARLLIRADGSALGNLGPHTSTEHVVAQALAMLAQAQCGTRGFPSAQGELQVFIETYPPPPTLLIVGAVHIAIPLIHYAHQLGFRAVVIDARSAFATPERFAHADELVLAWPDEALPARITTNSYVALLTHDPKLDDPALLVALPSPARYVGALGSKKTHAQRVARLAEQGLPPEQLARLHAPIGLPLGGRTPAEIALSIMAEIVAERNRPA